MSIQNYCLNESDIFGWPDRSPANKITPASFLSRSNDWFSMTESNYEYYGPVIIAVTSPGVLDHLPAMW